MVTRAQAGDPDAREEVLLRYREPLARFLRGRLSPQERGALDTADLVQETLAAVLEALEPVLSAHRP